ncbi:hypothetical protein [Mesorhizobium sp. 128a]
MNIEPEGGFATRIWKQVSHPKGQRSAAWVGGLGLGRELTLHGELIRKRPSNVLMAVD